MIPLRKSWLRLHLSTCVLLLLTLGALMGANLRVRDLGLSTGVYSGRWPTSYYQCFALGWPRTIVSDSLYLGSVPDREENKSVFTFKGLPTAKETPSVKQVLAGLEPENRPIWEHWCLGINLATAMGILLVVALLCEWTIRRKYLWLSGMAVAFLTFGACVAINAYPQRGHMYIGVEDPNEGTERALHRFILLPAGLWGWDRFQVVEAVSSSINNRPYEDYQPGSPTTFPPHWLVVMSEIEWRYGWPLTYDTQSYGIAGSQSTLTQFLADHSEPFHGRDWDERAFAFNCALSVALALLSGVLFVCAVRYYQRRVRPSTPSA